MLFSATIYDRRLVLLSEDCDLRLYRDSNPSLREIFTGGLVRMLTITDLIAVLGLCATFYSLGYVRGKHDAKIQK